MLSTGGWVIPGRRFVMMAMADMAAMAGRCAPNGAAGKGARLLAGLGKQRSSSFRSVANGRAVQAAVAAVVLASHAVWPAIGAAQPAGVGKPAAAAQGRAAGQSAGKGTRERPRRELLRTETKKFGNWALTCEEYSDKPGKPVCSAMLKIVDARSKRLLFAWILARQASTGQIVGLVQTPTGVAIDPGVVFRFSRFERKFGYTSCEPGRCSSIVPLGLALRKEIGRSKKGHITIVSITGRKINFEILPQGFDKAYRAVLAVK